MLGTFKWGWFSQKNSGSLYTNATQIGFAEGAAFSDFMGTAISLNAAGDKFAVSVPYTDSGSKTDVGSINLYQANGFGKGTIIGDGSGHLIGARGVYMNAEGTKVSFVSAFNILANYTNSSGTTWVKTFDYNARSTLELRPDSTLNINAIGCPLSTVSGLSATGLVRVIEYNGSSIIPKGSPILGGKVDQRCGAGLSLSKDGTILAVGSPFVVAPRLSSECGSVSAFIWDGIDWVKRGKTLSGSTGGETFGNRIALNSNGNIMAISAPNRINPNTSRGCVEVYEWSGIDWAKKGSTIYPPLITSDYFGSAIDINWRGNILVIGDYQDDPGTTIDGGTVSIIQWNGTDWVNCVRILSGGTSSDDFGYCVSINQLGDRIAVGRRGYDAGGINQRGSATVFQLS